MAWIDAHAHLADPRLDPTRDEILERSQKNQITAWIQGGVDPSDWARQKKLQAKWGKSIITSFGLHPWWVVTQSESEVRAAFEELEKQAGEAWFLGEMGLDSSKRLPKPHVLVQNPLEHQKWAFTLQLRLALKLKKPLVLHILNEHEEALKILEKEAISTVSGIVHSYSGSAEQMVRYVRLGLLISVSGGVTQNGFQSLKKAVKVAEASSLVIETDSPDQPPLGAGTLNEPSQLIPIAKAVGAIRGESYEEVLDRSAVNLRRVFKL